MFGTVEIKGRPIKLAFLVDADSATQTRRAIQIASTLWGGTFCPIIPLYNRSPRSWQKGHVLPPPVKELILGYIDAFDPDVLVQLSTTVPQYVKDLGLELMHIDEVWGKVDEESFDSPQIGIGIFELLRDVFQQSFKYKLKYPFEIVVAKIPNRLGLFWSSVFGELPADLAVTLGKYYQDPLDIRFVSDLPNNVRDLLSPKKLFPRRITQHALQFRRRSGYYQRAFAFFFDATNVGDVVDYWNLRALGRNVLPVPKQFIDNSQFREITIEFLKENRLPWRHDPTHCDHANFIRAHSCTMDEMQAYATSLKLVPPADHKSKDPYFGLQHWYPRIWDEWARDKDGVVPDDTFMEDEESVDLDSERQEIRIPCVMPAFAQKYAYRSRYRCANELSFEFYGQKEYLAEVFPKSSGQEYTRAIAGGVSLGDWRVGRNGLVNLIKWRHRTSRQLLSAEEVFFGWLSDRGWKPTLSPPGILAKQIYKQVGGHVGVAIREPVISLLEHMNGGNAVHSTVSSAISKDDEGRELSIAKVKSMLAQSDSPRDLHEYLVSIGAFRLGLRIQCPECLRRSWFDLESIGATFKCPKCLHAFEAIGNVDRAPWCYKTAGPFSVQGYADGAYAVLRAIDFFDDRKMNTMRTTPVVSFVAEGKGRRKLEADFALFWQESLFGEIRNGIVIGECKTYGRFEDKDFKRMRTLAREFPGACLAFCTFRKSLSRREVAAIKRLAKRGRRHWKSDQPVNPILVLTGNELLADMGPPYCWDEALKSKYGRVTGLLELCNISQQIYLGLPRWEEDWREKWEKKRNRFLRAKQLDSTEPSSNPLNV